MTYNIIHIACLIMHNRTREHGIFSCGLVRSKVEGRGLWREGNGMEGRGGEVGSSSATTYNSRVPPGFCVAALDIKAVSLKPQT